MINTDIIGSLLAVNVLQLVQIVFPVVLVLVILLFVYCRKERIINYITGKPYDENSESEMRERRFCERRFLTEKRGERRRGERRAPGPKTV